MPQVQGKDLKFFTYMNLLLELPIPNGETPIEYAGKYASLYNVSTWSDLCRELGVQVSETQSAKVALTRAVENARKANIQPIVYSKNNEDPADLMKRAFELMAPKQELNEARILELIRQNQTYKGIELKRPATEPKKIDGIFHKEFERVLNYIYNELNVYIYGPAGTGKTQIAEQVAQALGLEYSAISVCAQSSKIDFLGYMDATGKYISTEFRKRYENGGIFLIDEIDNGNPNILAVLNAALANGQMAFPDGMIKAHSDFRCIAAANTFGTGATEQYIGRNPIDAATQNRFLKVFVGYDNELEARIYGNEAFDIVSNCRKNLEGQTGWVLSMRDVSRVSKLLSSGMDKKQVIQICIFDQLAPQFHKFIK
jgi:hypothetical protein